MRRHQIIVVTALFVLLAAACGTRLEDADFIAAAKGKGVESIGGEDATDVVNDLLPGGDDGSGGSTGGGGGGGSTGGGGSKSGGGGSKSGGTGGGSAGGGTSTASSCTGTNTASDVGVTPTGITVGNITAEGGPLGPDPFTPMREGVRLYFQQLNAEGGVCGRKVKFVSCDDQENPERDKECAHQLIDTQKVFALVGGSTDAFAAAKDINDKGVPDVGGIPIGNAYYKYPMLYTLYGAAGYPRTGEEVGIDGKLFIQSGEYKWFKEKLGITKAAVIFYSIPISQTAGAFMKAGLEKEDIEVVYTPNGGAGRDPANPSWDTEVVNLRAAGAQAIWQAIDISGFQKLCQSMDKFDFKVKAAISTVQGMGQLVENFSFPCRESIYATASTPPYGETGFPEIAKIHQALKKFNPDRKMHQWIVDGWSAAKLFTEAVRSLGADVTRAGLLKYLNAQDGSNTLDGLVEPYNLDWRPNSRDFGKPFQDCFSVGKWVEAEKTFRKQTSENIICVPSTYYSYTPTDDGS